MRTVDDLQKSNSFALLLSGASPDQGRHTAHRFENEPALFPSRFAALGSSAILTDPEGVSPSITADVPGTYAVQLIVNDGILDSDSDSVVITATQADVDAPIISNCPLNITPDSDPDKIDKNGDGFITQGELASAGKGRKGRKRRKGRRRGKGKRG